MARSAADFEVRDIDDVAADYGRAQRAAAQPSVAARTTLAARLATAEGLRDAIVLREIFGSPRSMQPLEPHRPELI